MAEDACSWGPCIHCWSVWTWSQNCQLPLLPPHWNSCRADDKNCHDSQVEWLHTVRKGCDPQALLCACKHGHLNVARWLQANCSACQRWTRQQQDPLAFFLEYPASFGSKVGGNLEILQWLLGEFNMADNLYRLVGAAVVAGSEDCFQFLMAQPEKYHQAARQSKSPLQRCLMLLAAENGRTTMLPALTALSQVTGVGASKSLFFQTRKISVQTPLLVLDELF